MGSCINLCKYAYDVPVVCNSETQYLRNIRTGRLTDFGDNVQLVSVLSEKGGVGKTTTCMSLAGVTAEASRTLVVDGDPQASASWWAANIDDEQRPFDFATATDVGH